MDVYKARAICGPDFADVVEYSLTEDGVIDLRKLEELEGRYGYNGGRG